MDILEWRLTNFTVVRAVLLDLAISLVLIQLSGNKFNLVHQTISCCEARAGWAQDCAALLLAA